MASSPLEEAPLSGINDDPLIETRYPPKGIRRPAPVGDWIAAGCGVEEGRAGCMVAHVGLRDRLAQVGGIGSAAENRPNPARTAAWQGDQEYCVPFDREEQVRQGRRLGQEVQWRVALQGELQAILNPSKSGIQRGHERALADDRVGD